MFRFVLKSALLFYSIENLALDIGEITLHIRYHKNLVFFFSASSSSWDILRCCAQNISLIEVRTKVNGLSVIRLLREISRNE